MYVDSAHGGSLCVTDHGAISHFRDDAAAGKFFSTDQAGQVLRFSDGVGGFLKIRFSDVEFLPGRSLS